MSFDVFDQIASQGRHAGHAQSHEWELPFGSTVVYGTERCALVLTVTLFNPESVRKVVFQSAAHQRATFQPWSIGEVAYKSARTCSASADVKRSGLQ